MLRMARLTDYGILLLTHFARDPARPVRSARELSAETQLPRPTVSKLLKALAHRGLLEAHRGVKGGFSLARRAEDVSVADVIGALEGPIGMTDCCADPGCCGLERTCAVRSNWRKINRVVLHALKGITLAEMARPLEPAAFRVLQTVPGERHGR